MREALAGTAILFVMMAISIELGFRLGRRRRERSDACTSQGTGAIEGSVFAVLGLLVAFTFSDAADRFDLRRQLVAEEANAIGTAWSRVDLLPVGQRTRVDTMFREYVLARIEGWEGVARRDPSAREAIARAEAVRERIWSEAMATIDASRQPALAQALLPPLNEMADVASLRRASLEMHAPWIIYQTVALVAVLAALVAGHAQGVAGARSPIHTVVFCAITAGTFYLILDLEFPRQGWIRIDGIDVVMREVLTARSRPGS